MLKIVQLGKYHWSYPGGLERCLGQLYKYYKTPRYNVSVDYVVFRDGFGSSIETVNGNTIFSIGAFAKVRSAPIYCPSRTMKKLLTRRYDIIQMHHPNPSMHLLYELVKRRNPGAKTILFWHSDISRQRVLKKFYGPWQKRLLSAADKIIVTSPNYLSSSFDLEFVQHKCEPLPFGQERNVEKPVFQGNHEILSVGRLVYYKGFEYLIEAMADPSLRAYKLTIIGDGPEKRKLQGKIYDLGLKRQINIINHVSDDELGEFYKRCDVFVLPSVDRAEAFGLVLLEAMSYGKPVITTAINSGTSYIVKDGDNGYVVPPRSSVALRDAILKIMSNEESKFKMGEASLGRIEKVFGLDAHFDRLHAIYESVVSDGNNST